MNLRLGTRGSHLAITQSGMVAASLEELGATVELVRIKTTGDKITDVALSRIGDRGLFVKEIEQALLDGAVDLAVHSMKDMPTTLPPGLVIACVPRRLPPLDCMVSLKHERFDALPRGARIGSGSLRRRAQLWAARSDLVLEELRGNVGTRVRKIAEQGLDATILALAGLSRLGVPGLEKGEPVRFRVPANWGEAVEGAQVWISPISPTVCLPAVGQGALCIETREDAAAVRGILERLDDAASHAAVDCERALMRLLEGGCQVPIGAWSRVEGGRLRVDAVLASPDGREVLRAEASGAVEDAEAIGERAGRALLDQGGGAIVAALREMPVSGS